MPHEGRGGHVCLGLACFGGVGQDELNRLAQVLNWRTGQTIADVGAGNGDVAREQAAPVGRSGWVYATEVDPGKLARLRKVAGHHLNFRVVGGPEVDLGLPETCCDSIVLRGVYHHVTKPLEIDASLRRSLKPGGRLAVIDFASMKFLT